MVANASAFDVRCQCGEVYHAEQTHIGSHIRCRKCSQLLEVRDQSAPRAVSKSDASTLSFTNSHTKTKGKQTFTKVGWAGVCVLILVCIGSLFLEELRPTRAPTQDSIQGPTSVLPLPPAHSETSAPNPVVPPSAISKYNEDVLELAPEEVKARGASRQIRDLGIDVITPEGQSVAILDRPDSAGGVVVTATGTDAIVGLQDGNTSGWFHVLHVPSGQVGWVPRSHVIIVRTQRPRPAPQFAEEYIGEGYAPTILIHNKTGYDLTVTIRESSYAIEPYGDLRIEEAPGTAKFQAYVSVPNVIPAVGSKEWKSGYRYDWTFWVGGHGR